MTSAPARPALLGAPTEQIEALLSELGQPAYRARQVRRWLAAGEALDFAAMTDLPARLREQLSARATVTDAHVETVHVSRDGTRKYVVGLGDGARVEAVMIPEGERRTLCLSSQVGCPVGCIFCASGIGGVARSLALDEVLAQYALVRDDVGGLTNVVFMGMGEPLLNYGVVERALRALNAPDGFGLGARRITVSTVGIAGKIGRLARCGLQFGLALSLHAPTEELRRRLVPFPQRASLDELVDAARDYFRLTGRRVTVEYVLLDGVNDGPAEAAALGRLLRRAAGGGGSGGGGFHVNLIPWNPVPELASLTPSSREAVERFARILRDAGWATTVRRQRGDDVAAACGQLARRSS